MTLYEKIPKLLKYGLIAGGLMLGGLGIITAVKPANVPSKLEQKITINYKDPIEQFFAERPITYIDYERINYGEIPKEKINVPEDFNERIRNYNLFKPKFKNQNKFEEDVLKEAEKLGYNQKNLENLTPQQAIKCVLDIVTSRFQYLDVDNDQEFIQKNGKHLKFDEYFALGKGDCDKYSAAFMAVFDIIKKTNPNLQNIYASGHDLGGNTINHAWNSLILLTKEKTLVTHIDPTAYDAGGELQAKKGSHIPKDNTEFLANFFLAVEANSMCYEKSELLFNRATVLDEKAFLISIMTENCIGLKDNQKMKSVRKKYETLCSQGLKDEELGAKITYGLFNIESNTKNQKTAEAYYQELSKKYPNSEYRIMASRELELLKMEEYLEQMEKFTNQMKKDTEEIIKTFPQIK